MSPTLETGDLVVIADDHLPHGCWPRGRVDKTYRGKDGVVRVADVITQWGVLRRPVVKLCKLDV